MNYYSNSYKETFKSILFFSIIFILFIMFLFINFSFSKSFCYINSIPFDLTISIMSIGFGYELTLVPTCIEIGFIGYSISKLLNIVEK